MTTVVLVKSDNCLLPDDNFGRVTRSLRIRRDQKSRQKLQKTEKTVANKKERKYTQRYIEN